MRTRSPAFCASAKLRGMASSAQQARHQRAVRAVAAAGGRETAVQKDLGFGRGFPQQLAGRQTDAHRTRRVAAGRPGHHRPENIKQTHRPLLCAEAINDNIRKTASQMSCIRLAIFGGVRGI